MQEKKGTYGVYGGDKRPKGTSAETLRFGDGVQQPSWQPLRKWTHPDIFSVFTNLAGKCHNYCMIEIRLRLRAESKEVIRVFMLNK